MSHMRGDARHEIMRREAERREMERREYHRREMERRLGDPYLRERERQVRQSTLMGGKQLALHVCIMFMHLQ